MRQANQKTSGRVKTSDAGGHRQDTFGHKMFFKSCFMCLHLNGMRTEPFENWEKVQSVTEMRLQEL